MLLSRLDLRQLFTEATASHEVTIQIAKQKMKEKLDKLNSIMPVFDEKTKKRMIEKSVEQFNKIYEKNQELYKEAERCYLELTGRYDCPIVHFVRWKYPAYMRIEIRSPFYRYKSKWTKLGSDTECVTEAIQAMHWAIAELKQMKKEEE